jgi:hypothetical protein
MLREDVDWIHAPACRLLAARLLVGRDASNADLSSHQTMLYPLHNLSS